MSPFSKGCPYVDLLEMIAQNVLFGTLLSEFAGGWQHIDCVTPPAEGLSQMRHLQEVGLTAKHEAKGCIARPLEF